MKKITALILVLVSALALCACGSGGSNTAETPAPSAGDGGYIEMLDAAIALIGGYSRELMDKVIPPEETEYYIDFYSHKDPPVDYLTELKNQFAEMADNYAATYGDDWKLSYKVKTVDCKDAEGRQKYLDYDHFYFNTYGIDMSKVDDVVFVTVDIHIEGSKDSNDKEKTLQCFRYNGNWYSFYGAMMGTKL